MSTETGSKRIIDINHQTEVLPHNVVDKDVQSMFLPFTLMQIILLGPRYCIKNNAITTNNLFNKVLLLSGIVFCVSLFAFRVVDIQISTWFTQRMQFYHLFLSLSYNFFGIFIIFVINLIQSESNVLFVLTIQKVHRVLKNEVNYLRRYIRNSWVFVAVIICIYIVYWGSICFLYQIIPFHVAIELLVLIHFDVNIIFAMRYIKLLEDKIVLWSRHVLLSDSDNQDEASRKRLFQTYLQILKSYEIYKNISQHSVGIFFFLSSLNYLFRSLHRFRYYLSIFYYVFRHLSVFSRTIYLIIF